MINYDTLDGLEAAELALTGDEEAANLTKMKAVQKLQVQSILARAKQ